VLNRVHSRSNHHITKSLTVSLEDGEETCIVGEKENALKHLERCRTHIGGAPADIFDAFFVRREDDASGDADSEA